MIMEALVYPFLVSNILFFVYETDFFVEYIRLLRLNKVFKIDKYEEHLETVQPDDSYWEWLAFDKPSFLTKLLSCPFCTCFWMNVAIYFLHKDIGLSMITLWFSIFLYLILKIIMRKTYE
jgi:hypothetical protein